MKLNRETMASEELVLTAFKLPRSMLTALDRAAALMDCGVPNRSAYVRNALFKSLNKESA